jgi:hypothetical protein
MLERPSVIPPTTQPDLTVLTKPDPMSLSEMEWMLSICRTNVLVKATPGALDQALEQITPWIATPLHVCDLPGPATLPMPSGGALLLRDVAALSAAQQEMLLDWLDLNGGNVQVVSATSMDLFAAVERGTFSDRLYYRLNTILADLQAAGEPHSPALLA